EAFIICHLVNCQLVTSVEYNDNKQQQSSQSQWPAAEQLLRFQISGHTSKLYITSRQPQRIRQITPCVLHFLRRYQALSVSRTFLNCDGLSFLYRPDPTSTAPQPLHNRFVCSKFYYCSEYRLSI